MDFIKELLRVVLIAVVSYLLTEGVITALLDLVVGIQLDPTQRLILVGLITTVVKAIDRHLHESGMAEKGLTRF